MAEDNSPVKPGQNRRLEAEQHRRVIIESAAKSVISTLSVQQRRFVIEYLVHGNASRAAETAGYAHPDKQGSRLRQNRKVKDAIDNYFRQQEMSAGEVAARLSEQASAAYADYIGDDGSVDLAAMRRDGKMHLVKEITYTRTGQRAVKFHDAQQALVHMGRKHGLFTEKTRVEDWQTDLVEALRDGRISPADVRAAYPDMAQRFLSEAGLNGNAGND